MTLSAGLAPTCRTVVILELIHARGHPQLSSHDSSHQECMSCGPVKLLCPTENWVMGNPDLFPKRKPGNGLPHPRGSRLGTRDPGVGRQ